MSNFHIDKNLWQQHAVIYDGYGETIGNHVWMLVYMAFFRLNTVPQKNKKRSLNVKFTTKELSQFFEIHYSLFFDIDFSQRPYYQLFIDYIKDDTQEKYKVNSYLDYLFFITSQIPIFVNQFKVYHGSRVHLQNGCPLFSDAFRIRKKVGARFQGGEIIHVTLHEKLVANLTSYYSIVNYSFPFLGTCLKRNLHVLLIHLRNTRDNLFYHQLKNKNTSPLIEHKTYVIDIIRLFDYKMVYGDDGEIINIRDLKHKIKVKMNTLKALLQQENDDFFTFNFIKNTPASRHKYAIQLFLKRSANIDFRVEQKADYTDYCHTQ